MQENSLMTLADFQIDIITPETAAAIDIHNSIIASMKDAASAMVSLCESLKRMRDNRSALRILRTIPKRLAELKSARRITTYRHMNVSEAAFCSQMHSSGSPSFSF